MQPARRLTHHPAWGVVQGKPMEFSVLKVTARGHLLLTSPDNRPVERMPLFLRGKKVAFVFDTIGRVNAPLYLAKPEGEAPSDWEGKKLSSVR